MDFTKFSAEETLRQAIELFSEKAIGYLDEDKKRPVLCIGADPNRDIVVGLEILEGGAVQLVLVDVVDWVTDSCDEEPDAHLLIDSDLIYKLNPNVAMSESAREGFTGEYEDETS